jgi:hypothetical protein
VSKIDRQLIYDSIDFCLNKDSSFIPGSYISFRREHAQELGKATKIWTVSEGVILDGPELGQVRWFGRWRKYSFFSEAGKVFEETCLREIAYFCETATRFHKVSLKEKKIAAVSVS